jgi:hypothetical protein
MRLTALAELRLSGRVVLEPLAGLSRLTRLQVGLLVAVWFMEADSFLLWWASQLLIACKFLA